ncbi:AMP-activated serine/threonine-protein kinase regulatory subunit [Coniosporium tulheliwenetii]|uniref:AMP-activated serine/threonine-protein kinase regulatory subunit n=1 Tax=Coniosporium tulheliwenetii TaxID=3383036 RepID=A0ACC2YU07_9PEZI|nr:AMP-activated serine/threonine-protein kinase regulatory subunit [Cladosporium sp. JES 115]
MSGVDAVDAHPNDSSPPPANITTPGPAGHESVFVQPSSYLRPRSHARPMTPVSTSTLLDVEQIEGLRAIRAFLKVRTSYDVLPLSFRLIIFDTALLVKKSLNILIQNGTAPLTPYETSTFAGLLTTSDYINVIQYYWQNPDALAQIDQFRLDSLRGPRGRPDRNRINCAEPAAIRSMSEDARIPREEDTLVDVDDETKRNMVVSVVTQYRILKFVAVNVKELQMLKKPLKDIGLGTYDDVQTANMDTPVMDVIHMLVKKNISSVPILDKDGKLGQYDLVDRMLTFPGILMNVFEAVDVITLIKGGVYDDLNLSVGDALLKRSDDFAGIYTCSLYDNLATIFDTIRKSRVHRLAVIDENNYLKGVLTLSDILEYILLEGEAEEH